MNAAAIAADEKVLRISSSFVRDRLEP